MSAQHTPGPWFVTSEDDFPTGQVSTTPLGNGDVVVTYGQHAKANAGRIAAAPDRLAALQELDERLRKCGSDPITAAEAYDSFYQGLVAEAIAKATGGAS